MYIKAGVGILFIGLIFGITQAPDYYRNQGAKAEHLLNEKRLETAVKEAVTQEKLNNLKDKLSYEIKYQEVRNEYAKELELTRINAAKSGGLLFNKERICAGISSGETKNESGSRVDEGTSKQELLPEPYATDIKELMLQADLETDKVRSLQRVIKDSPCMSVVSDKAKE
jgi:hypothetical protein